MERYQNIIIGFGKAGKTLAGKLAAKGESTLLVEKNPLQFGGSCPNVACVPTKTLEHFARESAALSGSFPEKAERYKNAILYKNAMTEKLRAKNYAKVTGAGAVVLVGEAHFLDSHTISVALKDGGVQEFYGERFFLDTGSRARIPEISGLSDSSRVYTSTTLMELTELPKRLAIIGGGFIGLEFASSYTNFGSSVTVLQAAPSFLPGLDKDIAEAVLESLKKRGIALESNVSITKVEDTGNVSLVHYTRDGETHTLEADAILVAAGRIPNAESLHLENAGIALGKRGEIPTDTHVATVVPHIFALGDVRGELQFTYISLDDSRIALSRLYGDGSYTTETRGAVPFSVFLDPPLGWVGLTEKEAVEKGYTVKVGRLSPAALPQSNVLRQPEGLLKAVIDEKTGHILGAQLFCSEAHELINLIKIAVDQKLPYTVLRDSIYTHPTMAEAFNDLFAV